MGVLLDALRQSKNDHFERLLDSLKEIHNRKLATAILEISEVQKWYYKS